MSRVRAFVGLPLQASVSEALVDAGEHIRLCDPSWRGEKWVRRENLHVTLKFVGSVPDEDISLLEEALGDGVQRHSAFELPAGRITAVPSRRRARMLWASFVDPSGTCTALAESVAATTLAFGAKPDDRPFTPHVTLVRAREPHPLSEDALLLAADRLDALSEPMSVTRVTLYASHLTPGGPVYEELHSYGLSRD